MPDKINNNNIILSFNKSSINLIDNEQKQNNENKVGIIKNDLILKIKKNSKINK